MGLLQPSSLLNLLNFKANSVRNNLSLTETKLKEQELTGPEIGELQSQKLIQEKELQALQLEINACMKQINPPEEQKNMGLIVEKKVK